MYLFSLPFVLVKELGWATVPVVTVVAFTFMGIESIADIIEMPFGMCSHLIFRPSLTTGPQEMTLPISPWIPTFTISKRRYCTFTQFPLVGTDKILSQVHVLSPSRGWPRDGRL
jgi:hypothetical protein